MTITERNTFTIYTRFILGNPLGGENPAKLLQYRFVNKYNVSLKRDLTKQKIIRRSTRNPNHNRVAHH